MTSSPTAAQVKQIASDEQYAGVLSEAGVLCDVVHLATPLRDDLVLQYSDENIAPPIYLACMLPATKGVLVPLFKANFVRAIGIHMFCLTSNLPSQCVADPLPPNSYLAWRPGRKNLHSFRSPLHHPP